MKERLILEIKGSKLLSTLFLTFAIILFVVSGYLLWDSLRPKYPQLPGAIIGGLFGLFGLFILYALSRLRSYKLYEDRLEVYMFAGVKTRSLFLRDIVEFEEHTTNEHKAYTAKIRTADKNLNIAIREAKIILIDDLAYRKLKNEILKRTSQAIQLVEVTDIDRKKLSLDKNIGAIASLMLLVFGLLWIKSGLSSYLHPDQEIRKQQFSKFGATAASVPVISKGKGSRVRIFLREYPEFKFHIYYGYAATDKDYLVQNVKPGDSLFLFVETGDYEKKLLKTKALTFSDKMINYSFVEVYGLSDMKQEYLSLKGYNAASVADNRLGIGIAFFGLVMIVGALFGLKKMLSNSTELS